MAQALSEEICGSCLCGAVRYRAGRVSRGPILCHCRECRAQSGHVYASFRVPDLELEIDGAERLRWVNASPDLHRGFCPTCGSMMFMRFPGQDQIWVSAGTADSLGGRNVTQEVCVSEAGSYYLRDPAIPQQTGLSRPDQGEEHA